MRNRANPLRFGAADMIEAVLTQPLMAYAFSAGAWWVFAVGACFGVMASGLLLLALGAIERAHDRRRHLNKVR